MATTFAGALSKLVMWIVVAVVTLGVLNWFVNYFLPDVIEKAPAFKSLEMVKDFAPYINVIVALLVGWMVVGSFSSLLYAIVEPKYGPSTAAAVRSMVKILGLGALLTAIAGGIAGGAAGVALGGFIGLVIGFATQQVLGQAVAGMFLLLSRPFKIGDMVDIAGEAGVRVKDIGVMFTVVERSDGNTVLIPSSMIVGQKIVVRTTS
ncbi:MAG: mechanosensitive ion channel domain-containing protein [Pyrobaculum sp.]